MSDEKEEALKKAITITISEINEEAKTLQCKFNELINYADKKEDNIEDNLISLFKKAVDISEAIYKFKRTTELKKEFDELLRFTADNVKTIDDDINNNIKKSLNPAKSIN
ncbi:MAG: hypothetical protein M1276_04005 [Deltaproteobacteria bacterium]|jgi:hypothetical protein|nr:hypothetical protein [Deltaproteobacteria bacterium]